ncbi:hypothetical protein SAMN04487975_1134 [Planococcus glaciei]|uniref:hypothetical protein n=1 Tax=Planococcus glaciei TaxID=459472 RepID=UPI00088A8008|nr:hypothetical protein [Planococcus glaciei]SDI19970.1 hypothetical protein SAMN04487975_1134 [Planococcus glaciei]
MEELKLTLNKLKIPKQLKTYINRSTFIKENLNKESLLIIEELFIYYDSLYIFDTSEFCASVVLVIKRTKDNNTFYYYLKEEIESNVFLQSKGKSKSNEKESTIITEDVLHRIFINASQVLFTNIDKIGTKEKIDLLSVYKSLGELEAIIKITNNDYFYKLKKLGESIFINFVERQTEK